MEEAPFLKLGGCFLELASCRFRKPREALWAALSTSLRRGAQFQMARATLSSLWACQIALVVARCSFSWSRRSCAEILARRSLIESLRKDLVQRAFLEVFYRDLTKRSLAEI